MSITNREKLIRNSNIELLRLLLIVLVIIHHFNDRSAGGGNALLIVNSSLRNNFLIFLQSITVCAVDCFLVISGYFMYGKKSIKVSKVFDILIIVIFYRLLNVCISSFIFNDFSFKNVILALLPCNYYAIFYCIIYLFSPYINVVFEKTNKRTDIIFMYLLFLFFILNPSLISFIDDKFNINLNVLSCISRIGDAEGYSIVNFFVCFVTGLLLHKYAIKRNNLLLILIFFLNVLLMSMFVINGIDSVWNYSCVFVYINAVCIFLLFNNLVFYSKTINFISKSVFSIFCIHTSSWLMKEWKITFITDNMLNSNSSLFITAILSCFLIFLICFIIDIVIYRALFKRVEIKVSKKIPFIVSIDYLEENEYE